jgi:hypothetical protein
MRTPYLQWFRDQGKGQEASDDTKATEDFIGSWPIARLMCEDGKDAEQKWKYLISKFEVNAMTYI